MVCIFGNVGTDGEPHAAFPTVLIPRFHKYVVVRSTGTKSLQKMALGGFIRAASLRHYQSPLLTWFAKHSPRHEKTVRSFHTILISGHRFGMSAAAGRRRMN